MLRRIILRPTIRQKIVRRQIAQHLTAQHLTVRRRIMLQQVIHRKIIPLQTIPLQTIPLKREPQTVQRMPGPLRQIMLTPTMLRGKTTPRNRLLRRRPMQRLPGRTHHVRSTALLRRRGRLHHRSTRMLLRRMSTSHTKLTYLLPWPAPTIWTLAIFVASSDASSVLMPSACVTRALTAPVPPLHEILVKG